MDFISNDKNEIFFVDGAETTMSDNYKDAFTSGSAHFLSMFGISHEVDVYVSQRSVLHKFDSQTLAWHKPPSYSQNNSVVCVYVDPKASLEEMMVSLAHEMIHVWQVDRGDLVGFNWKGEDLSHLPYQLHPWEIEAHGNQEKIAEYFYNDKEPTITTLNTIRLNTDHVFKAIMDEGMAVMKKKKWIKIAKVAATVGLGALIGM